MQELSCWISEKSYILSSHQKHPGEPNAQSPTVACGWASYRPAGVFTRGMPQSGAENRFPVPQVLISVRLGQIYGLLKLLMKNWEIRKKTGRERACLSLDSQEHREEGIHLQGHSGLRCEAHIPTFGALTTRLWATQYNSLSIFSVGIAPACTNNAIFIGTARDWLYNLLAKALSWDGQ